MSSGRFMDHRAGVLIVSPLAAAAAGAWLGPWAGLAAAVAVTGMIAWRLRRDHRRLAALEDRRQRADADAADLRRRTQHAERQHTEMRVQARVAELQRQRLLDILNAFHDAVIVTDAFNELALVNESARHLLRITREAATQPIERVLDDPQLVKLIKDTREGEHTLHRHVERRITRDGRTGVFDVSVSAIAEGETPTARPDHGVITILRDITRRKELDEMKNELISNVSHELRTPLASIQAYLEMLVDGEATDEAARRQFYAIMQSEAARLSRLIENMLNLNRIEAGLLTVHREPIVLTELIDAAVALLRPQADAGRIELIAERSPASPRVAADRDLIFQVLVNLLGNALKYTPAGGRVTVATSPDAAAERVRVSVADTGPGIPEADIPRLFDKFYRVQANAHIARGTGLGLNLVRRIVRDMHDGELEVKSAVGRGSTFTFALPIADPTTGGAP